MPRAFKHKTPGAVGSTTAADGRDIQVPADQLVVTDDPLVINALESHDWLIEVDASEPGKPGRADKAAKAAGGEK